jgi:hypothetical protein
LKKKKTDVSRVQYHPKKSFFRVKKDSQKETLSLQQRHGSSYLEFSASFFDFGKHAASPTDNCETECSRAPHAHSSSARDSA